VNHLFRGSFIGGRFVRAESGVVFHSENPANPDHIVFECQADLKHIDTAVLAAREALPAWRALSLEDRISAVLRLKDCLSRHEERIASAITMEMGKVSSEAHVEAKSIGGKIDALVRLLPTELPKAAEGAPGEQRFRALGVVGVIGPYNFPIHLLNTHVIPALLTGNTVVAKPSEVTPLVGQRYAELFEEAELPPGVFNLVQGLGKSGAHLAAHPDLASVVFTGSFRTGRLIRQAVFDQPHKKVALELGGKNMAVVLDDADLDQVVREVLLGALLTTGQRCTATSRVIATPGIAGNLRDALVAAFSKIVPDDPLASGTFMGPLADRVGFKRFFDHLETAKAAGVNVLLDSKSLHGGYYATPGIYEVKGHEAIVSEELFGPHICLEVARDEDDAYQRASQSAYGLSASLFSEREEAFERFYYEVPAGVMNFNRSTNGASGLLPFGGLGKSGNFHPTGSFSLRLTTYPVAVMGAPYGSISPHGALESLLEKE